MFDSEDGNLSTDLAHAINLVRNFLPAGWDAMRSGRYEHIERRAFERVRREWFDAMDIHLVCGTLINAAKAIEDIVAEDTSSSPIREALFNQSKYAREVVAALQKIAAS